MTGANRGLISIVLCLSLSGMLAAQDPMVPPPPQEQQPSSSRPLDREQQEDKASQDILNRNHLPDSTAKTPAIEELPAAPSTAMKAQRPEPTGTAAAPAGRISGSAASQPAGVAIAPAKQRQVRSILIKVGALAGAGIALGTVYGLSKASPATPPGSR
jgi:hypothetical protein